MFARLEIANPTEAQRKRAERWGNSIGRSTRRLCRERGCILAAFRERGMSVNFVRIACTKRDESDRFLATC